MCGSSEIAEDVTHDVFIALMRDGGQFDPIETAGVLDQRRIADQIDEAGAQYRK
jgi:hypothetical protein